MKVQFLNREKTIKAASNADIVSWMRSNDLEHYRSNEDFIKAYSERKKLFENIQIATENEDAFVQSLEKNKIIKIFQNKLFVSFKKSM